jgi:Protein of unknown function (DUF1580)
MAIDTREESVYPLPRIRQFLPPSTRTGKPVHPSVVFRWIKNGLKAGDGSTVRLEAVKCGSALCTSREAVERFFAELTARSGLVTAPRVASRHERERTSRDLVELGLK